MYIPGYKNTTRRNEKALGLAQQLRPRDNHSYNFWAVG